MIRDFSLVFLLLISDRRNLHRDSRRDTEQNVPCIGTAQEQGNYHVLFLGLKVMDLHHSCINGYTTGITYHSKLSNAPLKTLLNIKLSVFYIVVYLCRNPVYMYVLNFNDRVFFLHILSDDCKVLGLCAVLFSVNIILRTTLEISVR